MRETAQEKYPKVTQREMGQNHFFEFLIIRQGVGGVKIYFDINKHLCYNENRL